MQFNPSEVRIEDHVVRAARACWVTTLDSRVIDLSRYPKMGIVLDLDTSHPLYAVVAYQRIDDDDQFEVLYDSIDEEEAQIFFKNLIQVLLNPQTVH